MEKFAKVALLPHCLTRKEHCMGYFRTCPRCGAHLDPGELCDCKESEKKSVDHHSEKAARRSWSLPTSSRPVATI